MNHVGPLLAAGDWWGLIVPFMLFIYALIQLISSKGGNTPARKPQRRPSAEPVERAMRPPQAPKGLPPAPASSQNQLNAEIEQFLKRAGQRQERARREAAPPKAPPTKSTSKAPPHPATESLRMRQDSNTVATSVEKHLSNRGFKDRSEHLADDIVRTDEMMEQHLKQAFSHRVGTLGDTTPKPALLPATDTAATVQSSMPASEVANLLADPRTLRNLIILNEILLRPEHRW